MDKKLGRHWHVIPIWHETGLNIKHMLHLYKGLNSLLSASTFGIEYNYIFLLLHDIWFINFLFSAPPSVSNVQIIGDVVEGNMIKGIGQYFGGREGPSKYEWLREDKDIGLVYLSFLCFFFHSWCGWTKIADDWSCFLIILLMVGL